MSKKYNIFQILFVIFVLVTFVLGAYVYSTMDLKKMILRSEGMSGTNLINHIPEGCPDLLIQQGAELHLYNTRIPREQGKNPVIFKSLDEYGAYLKKIDASCPILFLQQENNAQGDNVYRVRPSPFNPLAGLPANSALLVPYEGQVIKHLDASRDNGYNQNMYPGFDPQGLHVGRISDIDVVHNITEQSQMSDNPMDSNWGGILYTQAQVDSGKYDENIVTKPNYVTPKGGQYLPIYGPPNPYP